MSITDYKNGLRVALARELITQTCLDMEQVAQRAGFGSTRQLRGPGDGCTRPHPARRVIMRWGNRVSYKLQASGCPKLSGTNACTQ